MVRPGRWSGLSLLLAACGGASVTPPAAPPSAPVRPEVTRPEPAAAVARSEARGLPQECAAGAEAGLCLPPQDFVERLCADDFPSVALAMFRKGTPWTRRYLSRDVEAWNASGGKTASGKMLFDEEVLVLRHRDAGAGGMVVNGQTGGYDVLRWNGSCASLSGDELTRRLPPKAKAAPIPWRVIEDHIQDALRQEERIAKLDEERRRECRGASAEKCEKLERKLGVAIAERIRGGAEVPLPLRLP
jgi:hypothetical protein